MNDLEKLAQMIDVSAVRADCTPEEIEQVAEIAEHFGCIAVFSLPYFIPLLTDRFAGSSKTCVGGVVGFPSGGETTRNKTQQARDRIKSGCREIDMVMNVGLAIAGAMREVEEDIRSVKAVCQDIPLKVILECHYLNDAQICLSTEACLRAGADWIKTGTGWAPTGATCENVALIKQTVGDRARVKAAGGIRDLNTLLEMHRLGAERFGIGLRTVQTIFDAARHKNDSGERLFAEPDH